MRAIIMLGNSSFPVEAEHLKRDEEDRLLKPVNGVEVILLFKSSEEEVLVVSTDFKSIPCGSRLR